MALIRVVTTRAPGLIPSLIKEIDHASNPVVLIPESFTLACETEIVNRSRDGGIFDLKIFSPSSLIREVRELTGRGNKKPISGDGQNMIISQVLHHYRCQADSWIPETVYALQPPHGGKTGRCRADLGRISANS